MILSTEAARGGGAFDEEDASSATGERCPWFCTAHELSSCLALRARRDSAHTTRAWCGAPPSPVARAKERCAPTRDPLVLIQPKTFFQQQHSSSLPRTFQVPTQQTMLFSCTSDRLCILCSGRCPMATSTQWQHEQQRKLEVRSLARFRSRRREGISLVRCRPFPARTQRTSPPKSNGSHFFLP